MCEIRSKLTRKPPEPLNFRPDVFIVNFEKKFTYFSGVSIVNFEQVYTVCDAFCSSKFHAHFFLLLKAAEKTKLLILKHRVIVK